MIIPLGLKSFFTKREYSKVTELDWGQLLSSEDLQVTAEHDLQDSHR